jgi:hypothetical protein
MTEMPQRELHDYIADISEHADVRASPRSSAILLARAANRQTRY